MSSSQFAGNLPVKVYHRDLMRLGIVTSRFDQHQKIKSGRLPPPHKSGKSMQSVAWWYGWEIAEALERERQQLEHEQPQEGLQTVRDAKGRPVRQPAEEATESVGD